MLEVDWGGIYDSMGDSKMKGCLGSECPDSCCVEKDMPNGTVGSTYRTSMFSGEFDYQEGYYGLFKDLGVIVELTRIGIVTLDQCMADDGTCKLEERKPLRCRMYPFSLDDWRPVSFFCPRTAVIINNNLPLLRKILHVRELLGLYDDMCWAVGIQSHLDLIKG